MADVTVTAANVKPTSTAIVQNVTYGESVTQGQPVYLSSGKYYKADANASATAAAAVGIALTPGGTDEFGIIATGGTIDVGGTLAVGRVYVVSATAGGIAPSADLSTGHYVTTLGVATASNRLLLNVKVSGVQYA